MIQRLIDFLNASPVNFLAVETLRKELEKAGFQKKDPAKPLGELNPGDQFYVTKCGCRYSRGGPHNRCCGCLRCHELRENLFRSPRGRLASSWAGSRTLLRTQAGSLRLLASPSSVLPAFSGSCWLPALGLCHILPHPPGKECPGRG